MKNKVFGVVAEFNPFHNGHKYQIDKIKEMGADLIIAVISGNFVQRGEVSILSKFDKAELAILNGYDLVVELPSFYAVQNADIFSEYATKILEILNVDYQVFGIEDENVSIIESIIKIQEKTEYVEKLLKFQKQGNSYIKSHELALEEFGFINKYKSNNILAISYIRSIINNKMKMKYIAIKRKNVDYNQEKSIENIASASYIRNNIEKSLIENVVPSNTFSYIKNKKYINNRMNEIFKMFKYLINVKTKEEIIRVYDFNDSIYNRVVRYINKSNNFEIFIRNIKNRNISINRIKRLMLNTLFDIHKEDIIKNKEIEYVRVLTMNEKGAKYIKKLNKENIFVNWKDIENNIKNRSVKLEKNAFTLFNLLTNIDENLNAKYIK